MKKKQNESFAEILHKELTKVFEQHIEDLKNMKVVEGIGNAEKLHTVRLHPFLAK